MQRWGIADMSVVNFMTRTVSVPRPPRLVSDGQRLKCWYDNLSWDLQNSWFTLFEIRSATGIPLTRLRTVLYRHGWITERKRGFPGLVFYHGPNGTDPLEGP